MKKTYVFILLIIPVMLIFAAGAMKYARGPYYICSTTDNDYLYLMSSLAMADSQQVFFTDHPGTTLQILGAATLKITHAFNSSGEELSSAVLKNPEHYLKAINIVLVSLNAILLFVIGLVAFNLTKNPGLALLLQFSPFYSDVLIRRGLNNVSCEPLLLFTSMLFVLILVKMIFSENIDKSARWYMVALAFVCGFGMATKVTFAPLLIIPLFVLPKLKNKIGFLLLTVLAAILWTWPVHSQYERIFSFFYAILTHKAWYGAGDAGFNTSFVLINFLIMLKELFFNPLNILFVITPVWIIVKFSRSAAADKSIRQDTSFRVLFAVVAALLLSAFIVIKQCAVRYGFPALCLMGFLLFVQFIFLQRRGYFRRYDANKITIFIIIFLVFSGAWEFFKFKDSFNNLLLVKNDSLAYYEKAENDYKNYRKVFINIQPKSIAPSALAGMSYGNNMTSRKYYHISDVSEGGFSAGLYSNALQKIYGDVYFFNVCSGEFYTWTRSFFIEDMIVKRQADKIVFYGPPDFIKKTEVLLPCRTGSVLHLKNVPGGIYDNIYVLEGIDIKAVDFEQNRYHCY